LPQHPLAHEPEQEAQLTRRDPAVGDGHRRGAHSPAPRHDLVEQLVFELADERRERDGVGTDPARPVDDPGTLHHARQLRSQRRAEGRHDPGHRLGIGWLGGPQLRGGQATRSALDTRDGQAFDGRPVDEATAGGALEPATHDRGRGAQCRTEEQAGLPGPVVAPRAAPVVAHAARPPSSVDSTAAKSRPNIRVAMAANRSASPVVS
jgi:hypothetical protein